MNATPRALVVSVVTTAATTSVAAVGGFHWWDPLLIWFAVVYSCCYSLSMSKAEQAAALCSPVYDDVPSGEAYPESCQHRSVVPVEGTFGTPWEPVVEVVAGLCTDCWEQLDAPVSVKGAPSVPLVPAGDTSVVPDVGNRYFIQGAYRGRHRNIAWGQSEPISAYDDPGRVERR